MSSFCNSIKVSFCAFALVKPQKLELISWCPFHIFTMGIDSFNFLSKLENWKRIFGAKWGERKEVVQSFREYYFVDEMNKLASLLVNWVKLNGGGWGVGFYILRMLGIQNTFTLQDDLRVYFKKDRSQMTSIYMNQNRTIPPQILAFLKV